MSNNNDQSKSFSRRAFLRRLREAAVPGEQNEGRRSLTAQTIKRLQRQGMSVSSLAQDNDLLQVRCGSTPGSFGDEKMDLLRPLAERIAWLDLGNTEVTDRGLEVVADMERLVRLYLQNTDTTDAGLERLSNLKQLEYLNLYGTNISDEGLKHLTACERLDTLYLWQTGVTEEGVAWLQEHLPDLEVTFGNSYFDSTDQSYDLL